MKAVLVIDMPTSCTGCPQGIYNKKWFCLATNKDIGILNTKTKPSWCPLKPMPKRKEYTEPKELEDYKVSQMLVMANADGWNACLKEITGETDDFQKETETR